MKSFVISFCILVIMTILILLVKGSANFGDTSNFKTKDKLPTHEIEREFHAPGTDENFHHEAIIGSREEIKKYTELSPNESRKRLSILIGRMDKNRDNYISKGELQQWIIQSIINLNEEDAKYRMKEYDTNNDKLLSRKELTENLHGMNLEEVKRLFNETKGDDYLKKHLRDDLYKFKLADKNKNGYLDVHEFAAFLFPYNFDYMVPYEIKRALEDYDQDDDNAISMEEYLAKEKYTSKEKQIEIDNFKLYDTNQNGKMEKKEMEVWLKPNLPRIVEHEVEHLFKATDVNKNGALTEDEILAKARLWVGSQVTDFGNHLIKMRDEL